MARLILALSRPRIGLGRQRTGLGLSMIAGLAVAVCALTATMSQAQDRQPNTYTVGVENLHYLPAYGLVDGQYVGYARDILDAFAEAAGLSLDYQPMPVPRLYASLAAGTIDFKFPDSPHWNAPFRKDHALSYSVPVAAYLDATVVRADQADMTPAQVRTLGTVTGFTPFPWLDRIKANDLTVAENADFQALVRQALTGRVDAAYANIAVVNRVLTEALNQPGALVVAPALPRDAGQYRLSTIHHPDVLAAFDAWMADHADMVARLKARHEVERGIEEGR